LTEHNYCSCFVKTLFGMESAKLVSSLIIQARNVKFRLEKCNFHGFRAHVIFNMSTKVVNSVTYTLQEDRKCQNIENLSFNENLDFHL